MAIEKPRGCGYRKVGGTYLVCDAPGRSCCKLPFELHICPTCNGGIKQARGWQWIDPKPWLKGPCRIGENGDPSARTYYVRAVNCPAAHPETLGEKVGLIWIGAEFYPTPEAFMQEAARQGISRRIKAVPREFVLGQTWVLLAHPHHRQIYRNADGEIVDNDKTAVWFAEGVEPEWIGGVFQLIQPTRIEKIVTDIEAKDAAAMAALREANITPVVVPHDDPDHAARGAKVEEAELI